MSERILKALMQMFAIIVRVDGVNNTGRNIVQSFLKMQLNQELVNQYLAVFDEFLEAHHQISQRKDGSAKRTSLNSVKVLKICTEINKELEQTQKVVVLIRLLEFLYSSDEISDQELEFATTVAESFNIPNEEFLHLKSFVEDKQESFPDREDFLFINNRTEHKWEKIKHYPCEQFTSESEVVVMKLPSVNMYVLKLYGKQELLLNGQNIYTDRIYIFTPGSSIRSTKVKPIYYSDVIGRFLVGTSASKITFTANHLSYTFSNGNLGLRDINLAEEGGRLVGIMGGSGAGKSTLLNVLNGNEKPSTGDVLINGINIHKSKKDLEGVIGHVTQDDLLIEELTVYQNLFYNAKLCFGDKRDGQIDELVLKTLSDLGLYETRHLKVGTPLDKTISGGQRKRLNIALELIREPSVLFVDEPTSGLSSRDSENIMDLLKELSLKGKLIFVVIHQPSSDIYKMFDKMLILDVGGFPIFYGNPVDAVIYFKRLINHVNCEESECGLCGNVNPEQIFNIIETKVLDEYGHHTKHRKFSPSEWSVFYREKIESKIVFPSNTPSPPTVTLKIPAWFSQLRIFIRRDVLSKLTNTQYVLINFLEAPVLAFILAFLVRYFNTDELLHHGYIYGENENIPAYLFMAVVVALFIGLTVSAEEIIKDRKIRKREKFLNLSNSSYLLSKVIILFVLSSIQTLCFVVIGNWILDIKGMWMDYWLVLFSVSCFANMLGLNVSSAFNSAITIYILIPFLIIPQLLLSGVLVKFDKLNPMVARQDGVPVWGEVMVSRWGFEALAVNQFSSNEFERIYFPFEKKYEEADFKTFFWLDRMNKKLESVQQRLVKRDFTIQFRNDIDLLRNEVILENDEAKENGYRLNFPKVNQLIVNEKNEFTNQVLLQELSSWLNNEFRNFYNRQSNFYRYDGKDAIVMAMEKGDLESLNVFAEKKVDKNQRSEFRQYIASAVHRLKKYDSLPYVSFQQDYQNQALSDLVKNKNDLSEKILEKDGKLIQRVNPIFKDPKDNLGRAHFFAPRKKFLGTWINTFTFNILVIWSMSLMLGITLYFDVFRKLLHYLGISFGFLKRGKK